MNPVILMISQVFTFCGITSIRMFLPIFTYFSMMRLALAFPSLSPQAFVNMAAKVPEWQISFPFLILIGILAGLELVAMRESNVKHFLATEIDKYAKPAVSILLACSIINTSQADEVSQIIEGSSQLQQAGISFSYVLAILGGGITAVLCYFRGVILDKIYSIDCDNSFGLQTLTNYAGEFAVLGVVLLLILLPIACLIITLLILAIAGIIKMCLAGYEKRFYHLCPQCQAAGNETKVFDSALLCPACGAVQNGVRQVGLFGLPSKKILYNSQVEKHQMQLIKARRCRWCGSQLKSGKTVCSCCGKHQWADRQFVNSYLKHVNTRAMILLGIALVSALCSGGALPWIGCIIVMVSFNPLVMRPLMVNLGVSNRISISFVNTFVNLFLGILILCVSFIPYAGLIYLVPFAIRYILARQRFLKTIQVNPYM